MAVTSGSILQQGTRVRVRRGTRPIDAELVGQTGVVVDSSEYSAHKVGIELDASHAVRVFMPEELEVVQAPALVTGDRESAKKRSALP